MKSPSLPAIQSNLTRSLQSAGEAGDISGTLQGIARAAQAAFGADLAVIVPVNPITDCIIGPEVMAGDLLDPQRLPQGEGNAQPADASQTSMSMMVNERVLRKGSWFIADWGAQTEYQSDFVQQEAIRSTVAVVLCEDGDHQARGILYLHFRTTQHFAAEVTASLQFFAGQAASRLKETWLHYHYQQIEHIEQEINRGLAEFEDLFRILQMYIHRVLDTTYSLLLAVYPLQGHNFDVFVNEGEKIITINNKDLRDAACQYAAETRKPILINHFSQEEDTLKFCMNTVEGTKPKEFYIFMPLVLRGDTFGVLSIQHDRPYAYNERSLPVLQLLANHVALALRNISLYNNLKRLNSTGQFLMELLGSEQASQSVVEQICEDARSDIAVLYPYNVERNDFLSQPLIAPENSASFVDTMNSERLQTFLRFMLQQKEPIFVREDKIVFPEHMRGDFTMWQGETAEYGHIRSIVAVTLRARAEIGVLLLYFEQPQRFDDPHRLYIGALINSTNLAIRDAQFIDTLIQRHTREREILDLIEHELRHTLDLEYMLTTILNQANTLLEAEGASILLYEQEMQMLEVKAALWPYSESLQALRIPLHDSKGITRLALTRKKPVRVHNVYDPEWRDHYISAENTTRFISELDVPFFSDEDEAIGVLNFESTREGAFSADDETFLNVLAEHIALAVKHARDYDEQKRMAQEEAALHQISKDMIGQLDSSISFQTILQHALDLTDASLGSLHLYDPEAHELTMVAQKYVDADMQSKRQGLHEGIVGYVASTKTLLNIDPTSSQWASLYIPYTKGARSELAVPMLFAGEELCGVLNVESRKAHCFTKQHEKLLSKLANLAVVALEHVERHQNALREKKRFELLYEGSQALGKLVELEQREEAYTITQRIAEKYGHWRVQVLRNGSDIPESTPALQIFPIHFSENRYGHLVLSSATTTLRNRVDRPFFEGIAQQLANTLYRLETTFKKREMEKQAAANNEMAWGGSLILEVVHRYGNSIGLVRSYVNDIRLDMKNQGITISTRAEQKLGLIVHAVHKLLAMKSDIENVMRTVGGTQAAELESEKLSPCELFDEVIEEIKIEHTLSSYIIRKVGCDERLRVRAIRPIVVSILRNLVMNSLTAMPNGGTLTLRAYRDGRFVALEVTDTGKGIPLHLYTRIFELGYSGKGSTGFGLWSAQHGARRCLGDLQLVSSQPGRGATFRLRLPGVRSSNIVDNPRNNQSGV